MSTSPISYGAGDAPRVWATLETPQGLAQASQDLNRAGLIGGSNS